MECNKYSIACNLRGSIGKQKTIKIGRNCSLIDLALGSSIVSMYERESCESTNMVPCQQAWPRLVKKN
mgnify:CR=1 FL=1